MSNFKERMKNIFIVLFSAISLYLSVNFEYFWFLLFIAFVSLIHFRRFIIWLLAGFIFFILSLSWINISMTKYGGVPFIISFGLIILLCLFLAFIQFGVAYSLWKLSKYNVHLLGFIWVFMEIIRSYYPYGGFPWLILGNLAVYLPFVGLSIGYITVYGMSFFLVYISSLIYHTYKTRKSLYVSVIFLLLCLLLILSYMHNAKIDENITKAEKLRIAVIQPFIRQDIKLNEFEFRREAEVTFPLIRQAIDEGAKVVFLPEYAFPFFFSHGYDEQFLKLMDLSYEAILIVGLVDIKYEDDELKPYTSAYMLHRGREIDRYDKIRLLPFGEYIPFPFGFIKEIFPAVSGPDYKPGSDYTPLSYGKLNIATFICFEVGYVDLVKRIARRSNLIAVLTNDGWFDNSLGVYQHLNIARARAMETGKYLIWVNNTGPSAVINPKGKIVAIIEYGNRGILVYDVYLLN